ncbi:polysaccharide lyase [Pedobacter jamesrossensis]|uniref:Polysaccharide lyase n=1 Tax=Pedobacter jamesrossensis TaxID=1908238 RepID=A0ABV8NMR7_9SPHI
MSQKINLFKLSGISMFFFSVIIAGCSKDSTEIESITSPTTEKLSVEKSMATAAIQAFPSNINTQFTHSDGSYSYSEASADFGMAALTGWNEDRAYISGNWARATLAPNSVSNGLIAGVDLSDGSAYEATFKVRFHSQFDWSRGGKVGFGFLIGEGNTGCDIATDGNGGSLRLMWYNSGSRVYFQPYVYHRDMAGPCGDTFGKSYPSTGSLVKGNTYTVHLYVKSNTGSSKNGWVQVLINGTTVLDQSIRWTTNDAQRLIKRLSFHNFRGGKDVAVLGSSQTSYIYFDDLVVNKIQ